MRKWMGIMAAIVVLMTCGCGKTTTQEFTDTIGTVYYDNVAHAYRFDTVARNGSTWTDDIVKADSEDKSVTTMLQRELVGKRVVIQYDTQGSNNREDWVAGAWRVQ